MDPNRLNLDPDPEFWLNLDLDPRGYVNNFEKTFFFKSRVPVQYEMKLNRGNIHPLTPIRK